MSVDSKAIVRSFGWVALANYANKGLGFVTTLILAKLLAPEDFGTVAVAAMVIDILYLCKDLGISQAIIYRKGDSKSVVSTGVILVTAVNLGLFALAWIAAPFIARFYEHQGLTSVIVLLSSNLVWQGLTSVPESLLRKNIDFKALVIPNVVPVIIASALGIVLALTGWGVWSLVIRTLTGSVLNMVLIWIYSPFKFEWRYDRQVGRELFGYGKHIVVASAFLISLYNVDRFFVSRFAGMAALGVYTLAMRIALMPVTELSHLVCRVMFPVLSAFNEEPERLRSAFLRTVRYSNVVAIPMSMGIAVFGPSLVLAIYGQKWAAMTVPLQLLSAYAFFRSVSSLLHETFKAVGRPALFQKFVLLRLVLIGALGAPALAWLDLAGMCVLLVVVYAAVLMLELEASRRMLSLNLGSMARCFAVPTVVSCALIPGVYGLLWAAGWDDRLPFLLTAVAVVAALYLVCLVQFEREVVDDVRRIVGNRKARVVTG